MKYAIIAAGEGQRLSKEGVDAPKPLVKIKGEHLIDRLIRIFADNDADDICVICNTSRLCIELGVCRATKRKGTCRPCNPCCFISSR